jgi:thioredoxin-dependent adenylylsulfate APS reductase
VLPEAAQLVGAHPAEVLAWAAQRYAGRITLATSFGVEDCVLISMAAERKLKLDYFTLDTQVLFPETYALWKRIEARYGVKVRGVLPKQTLAEQAAAEGEALWAREPNRCCNLRKVEPLKEHLAGYAAWVTAIRREQSKDRANAAELERDARFGLMKVNPLVAWTNRDVWRYVHDAEVPYNPLHDRGYPSIGCIHCTSPVKPGEDPRSGRWRGTEKTECGLHVETTEAKP